jgi:hypothetical protein
MTLVLAIYRKGAVQVGSEAGLLGIFWLFAPLGAPIMLGMIIWEMFR